MQSPSSSFAILISLYKKDPVTSDGVLSQTLLLFFFILFGLQHACDR